MLAVIKKFSHICILFFLSPILFAKPIIDLDVIQDLKSQSYTLSKNNNESYISLILFLNPSADKKLLLKEIKQIPESRIQDMEDMPFVIMQMPKQLRLFNQIAQDSSIAQISLTKVAEQELDITAQAIKLAPSTFYPDINNWWAHGYTGKDEIVGLIDTGVDPLHPALADKKLILRKEEGSDFSKYKNGVKAPHATGIACIYASGDQHYKGISYGANTIVSGLSGEETADTSSFMLTMGTLDWMLNRAEVKLPGIINYSMGNGKLDVDCPSCPEWSGLAKVMDYVINVKKVLWVKSAGNKGYTNPTDQFPFASTLTVPADNYNGITVANMNTVVPTADGVFKTAERAKHSIKETSSRGPTPYGRRKPDITAPGHDTRTCAPDPQIYGFDYSKMDYKEGYRLMGGTSSAAPHVGAAVLLLRSAGIKNPIAIKALLINSADTWTDSNNENSGHFKIKGSEWNRTYGWGYLNMEKAFDQRNNIIESMVTAENPVWEYQTQVKKGEKITLVHERRVGYSANGEEWQISPLALKLIDLDNNTVIDMDNSPKDTVHQVANCKREPQSKKCLNKDTPINALVRVTLLTKKIDGSTNEPFALVVPSKD